MGFFTVDGLPSNSVSEVTCQSGSLTETDGRQMSLFGVTTAYLCRGFGTVWRWLMVAPRSSLKAQPHDQPRTVSRKCLRKTVGFSKRDPLFLARHCGSHLGSSGTNTQTCTTSPFDIVTQAVALILIRQAKSKVIFTFASSSLIITFLG